MWDFEFYPTNQVMSISISRNSVRGWSLSTDYQHSLPESEVPREPVPGQHRSWFPVGEGAGYGV